MRKLNLTMAITVLIVALLDQLSKIAILRTITPGEPMYIIGDWFRFYLTFNSGAAFSFGRGHTWVFTIIQLAFLVLIAVAASRKYFRSPLTAIPAALIAGGALGNVIDRLFRAPGFFIGHVVDFISVGNFAIFNIADSAITVGAILFILGSLLEGKDSTATSEKEASL